MIKFSNRKQSLLAKPLVCQLSSYVFQLTHICVAACRTTFENDSVAISINNVRPLDAEARFGRCGSHFVFVSRVSQGQRQYKVKRLMQWRKMSDESRVNWRTFQFNRTLRPRQQLGLKQQTEGHLFTSALGSSTPRDDADRCCTRIGVLPGKRDIHPHPGTVTVHSRQNVASPAPSRAKANLETALSLTRVGWPFPTSEILTVTSSLPGPRNNV